MEGTWILGYMTDTLDQLARSRSRGRHFDDGLLIPGNLGFWGRLFVYYLLFDSGILLY